MSIAHPDEDDCPLRPVPRAKQLLGILGQVFVMSRIPDQSPSGPRGGAETDSKPEPRLYGAFPAVSSVEDAYKQIAVLLVQPAHSPEWREEFNALASLLEREDWRKDEALGVVTPDGEEDLFPATLVWQAVEALKSTFLISPPIVNGTVATRLALPVAGKEVMAAGTHLNVFALPPGDGTFPDTVFKDAFRPCVTSSDPMNLGANFALWDYIARVGIATALKRGVVTEQWVKNVTGACGPCSATLRYEYRVHATHLSARVYPSERSDLVPCYRDEGAGGKINTEIRELNTLLLRLGITRDTLEGETSKGKGGQLHSTWFDGPKCIACDKYVREPSRNWPFSHYKHIKSIAHLKHAAETILRLRGQGGNGG